MKKQVQTIVRNCILCAQFNRGPRMHHLPEYRKIEGLFHTLLLDCVFGFPITDEGYVGIFFVTEKLSRYTYGVPIRSKSESEISRELFNYMAMFGVPYQILSDNGREFVNKLMAKLLQTTGVEHSVISPYHPETNGISRDAITWPTFGTTRSRQTAYERNHSLHQSSSPGVTREVGS